MKKRILLILLALIIASLLVPIVEARRRKVVYLDDYLWFNYRSGSINFRADKYSYHTLMIDLDRDHTVCATTDYMGYSSVYGDVTHYGLVRRLGSKLFQWVGGLGTLKIDSGTKHVRFDTSEWFCFKIKDRKPPSNWIVSIYKSNGIRRRKITSRFWYSLDGGDTWLSYRPNRWRLR